MDLGTVGAYFAAFLVPYFIGGVPSGYLIGRSQGLDIRNHGSGNIGATNVTRVLGKGLGRLCFLCDFAKGLLPTLAAVLVVRGGHVADQAGVFAILAAFGTVAGHVWTPYLKFKGGKGVATAAGAMMAIDPPATLLAAVVWIGCYFGSRVVSIASIAASIALPAAGFVCKFMGFWNASSAELALMVVLGVVSVLKHSSNIKRLVEGKENAFKKDGAEGK